jgi:hypothetical protein
MADNITRIIPASPSLGHLPSLPKEKGGHGRGAFTKESPVKMKRSLLSTKPTMPPKDHGKGNVLDIHA